MTNLAEDFLLLATDDAKGTPVLDSTTLGYALAGAILTDLSLADRVRVPAKGEDGAGRVLVVSAEPTGDRLLDSALATLAEGKPRKPADVVEKLTRKLRPQVISSLQDKGVLHSDQGKFLGVLPREIWLPTDLSPEPELRHALNGALVEGQQPTPRIAALIALLSATNSLTKVIQTTDKRALKARAKEISDGDWGAKAVKDAIDAMTAIIATVVITSSTS